jgi:DNA-binding GntR family transcriptional regulator
MTANLLRDGRPRSARSDDRGDVVAATGASNAGFTAASDVYAALLNKITIGEYPAGSRLTELALAAEYQVSRTPIREAMGRLVQDGLVERSGRELRVRAFGPEEVLEIYEVRIALERAAARAAANSRTDLDMARIRAAVSDMEALTSTAAADRSRLAHAYHFSVWQAAHNVFLNDALIQLHAKVAALVYSTLTDDERWLTVVEESRAISDAIAARDADLAGRLNEQHMTKNRDVRVEIYGRAASAFNDSSRS